MRTSFKDKVDKVFEHFLMMVTLILLTMLLGGVIAMAFAVVIKIFKWWLKLMKEPVKKSDN